jgi:hypothetical protein
MMDVRPNLKVGFESWREGRASRQEGRRHDIKGSTGWTSPRWSYRRASPARWLSLRFAFAAGLPA